MNNEQPQVLIVILNYGTYEMTIDLINQLHSELEYKNYSIMVVDNYSPNNSAKILRERSSDLDYIFYPNNTNSGYAAGNNIGIRYAIEHNYMYTWILNNDVELRDKSVLMHMISVMERDASIGCIGPKIYTKEETVCAPYHKRPSFFDMTFGVFFHKRNRKKYSNTSRVVYRVYGCCMLLRNSMMNQIGCLDERTFLYGEEQILAERLLSIGATSYYDSEVSIKHNESGTMKKMSKASKDLRIRESERSREIYLKDYRRFNRIERKMCHFVWRLIYRLR